MLVNYLQKNFEHFLHHFLATIFDSVVNITLQHFQVLKRALRCKIIYQNCDVKFKKTMFDKYISGEIMDFTAAILKLAIMINYSKNQALVTKF